MNNRIKKVVVTGGSGKAGRVCVEDLIAHGYEVFNVDNVVPTNDLCPFIVADLSNSAHRGKIKISLEKQIGDQSVQPRVLCRRAISSTGPV